MKTSIALTPEMEAEFDALWMYYPRRREKIDAKKAYAKVRQKFSAAQIRDGMELDIAQWRRDKRELKFIPYMASWLRSTDFDDEFEAAADDKEILSLAKELEMAEKERLRLETLDMQWAVEKHYHRCDEMCAEGCRYAGERR